MRVSSTTVTFITEKANRKLIFFQKSPECHAMHKAGLSQQIIIVA